jgi:phospholipase/lecithinase/hemolysin
MSYTIIYSFGDSLSDAGDAYLLTSSPIADVLSTLGYDISAEPVSPPYYAETYGGTLTADVFSNGPVWAQDLDASLGLPVLSPGTVGITVSSLEAIGTAEAMANGVPNFLINASVNSLVDAVEAAGSVSNGYITIANGAAGGTDFAIGGAVTGATGEETDPLIGLTDLNAQLTNFAYSVGTPAANALATVWIGSNDILDILQDPNFGTLYPVATTLATVGATTAGTDVAESVANEVSFVGSLIAQGISNLLVLDVPDLGVVPAITEDYASETTAATVLSEDYNTLLNAALAPLDSGGVQISIVNTFSLIDQAVNDGAAYGLTNVTSPVYTGTFTADTGSIVSTDSAVQDTYLFFDHQHPTEAVQAFVAAAAYDVVGCFAGGTRLRTARGPVAVEALRVGDRAVLADGDVQEIIWIGHRVVDCAAHAKPEDVWPVRVHRGAFGRGAPAKDVFLSPDHAVFVDGVLIPVKHLIDGRAIVQVRRDTVTYWHVELPRHGVLLAEGLPCESFLDTGTRADDGTARPRRADYVSQVWEAHGYAPLVVTGPRLDAARALIQ